MAQLCSSNGNQVMSILHVDWNRACLKQVGTQYYEFHPKRSAMWLCWRKENLKDPRRQIWAKTRVRDNDIGRERPVKLFICAEKKKKILPELAFKYILSSKVGPVVHQHIWLPNHVGREPANNVLISNSKHPYIGFIFTHYKSLSFKYIYLWLYSLCNVHVFLSFKCIYSYFNCVHYEPLTNPSLYLILVTPSYSLAFQAKFTSSHSWEVFLVFTRVSAFVSHDATYVTQPNIGCQYLVLFVLEWHNWERSFVWWLVSIVFTNDTKSTICWRASPNVKLMGDFSSTTGLDVQTFSKKKTVIWILRLKHISKAKTIPLKAVVREQ